MTIILVFIAAKIVILAVTGVLLYKVFWPELRRPRPQYPMPGVRCIYCRATPALLHSEDQRWEGDELVLVQTFECRECHMPFWRLERIHAVENKTV